MHLVDSAGQPLSGVDVDLRADADPGPFASGRTDGHGGYSAPYTSTHAGAYRFGAAVHLASGVVSLSESDSVLFVAGPPDQQHSSLTTSVSTLAADGVSQLSVTIHLADAFDNAVAGTAYAFSVSGSGNSPSGDSGTTDANGMGTLLLTSTRAETKTVSLTAPFELQQAVTFVPGPPSSIAFLTPDIGAVYAGETLPLLTVQLLDANGNAESGGGNTISVSISGSATVSLLGTTARAPSGGLAVFDDLDVNGEASALTLTAQCGSLTASTNAFDVTSWRQLGPWGGQVHGIAHYGNYAPGERLTFIATANGVFEDTYDGSHWSDISDELGPRDVTALGMAYDGSNPPVLFAQTANAGVFTRTLDGSPWVAAGAGLGTATVRAFTKYGSWVAATDAGVFVNSGSGWVASNSGLSDLDLSYANSTLGGLEVGTSSGRVFESLDDGATWSQKGSGLNGPIVGIIERSDGVLAAATPSALYLFDGADWAVDPTQPATQLKSVGSGYTMGGLRVLSADLGLIYNLSPGEDFKTFGAGAPPAFITSFEFGQNDTQIPQLIGTETGHLPAGRLRASLAALERWPVGDDGSRHRG